MSDDVIAKTIEASNQWASFFNQGNASGCASMYEEDAQMVAKPFGTYNGRQQIEGFWENLFEQGFADVRYIDPVIEAIDDNTTVLVSRWAMNNAEGVITRELWVRQPDGTMRLREDHFEATSTNAE